VLAVAGVLVRLSGFIYRAPLARLIHSEGLGIYQMALPAFYALLSLAVGGVPLAVSNLVAEYTACGRPHVARRVLHLALTGVSATAAAAAVTLALASHRLAATLGDPRAAYSLIALAPAIFLFSLEGCYRAYFQGSQLMTPTALAQVAEQALRITTTLLLAFALYPFGLPYAAAGAAGGASAGGLASLAYLWMSYRRLPQERPQRWDSGEPDCRLIGRILTLSWPATLGAVILPLLTLADVGIIQRSLQAAGFTRAQATALYGQYSGMAYTLVGLPSVLTGALASALMPVAASAQAQHDRTAISRRVRLSVRVTALICLPAALGLMVLARPLVTLIFGEPAAAIPLVWLAPVAFLLPLSSVMASVLLGLGRTGIPVRNFAIALVVKLGLDYLLGTRFGIRGVAAAAVSAYLIICWLNTIALERELGEFLPWGSLLWGPAASAAAMTGAMLLLARLRPAAGEWLLLGCELAAAPMAYAAALAITGGLRRAELADLAGPLAPRLWRWLQLWPRE